jgi:hypothetical protein
MYKLNHAPLSLRLGVRIFSLIVGREHSPQWGIKEPVMAKTDKPDKAEEAETKPGILLPEGLTFYTRYVQRDAKVENFDRILADCRIDGTFIFQVGLHAPTGTISKGKAYQLGATARIKRVQGNRVEIYLNGVDPAAGVDYTTVTEVLELPF